MPRHARSPAALGGARRGGVGQHRGHRRGPPRAAHGPAGRRPPPQPPAECAISSTPRLRRDPIPAPPGGPPSLPLATYVSQARLRAHLRALVRGQVQNPSLPLGYLHWQKLASLFVVFTRPLLSISGAGVRQCCWWVAYPGIVSSARSGSEAQRASARRSKAAPGPSRDILLVVLAAAVPPAAGWPRLACPVGRVATLAPSNLTVPTLCPHCAHQVLGPARPAARGQVEDDTVHDLGLPALPPRVYGERGKRECISNHYSRSASAQEPLLEP